MESLIRLDHIQVNCCPEDKFAAIKMAAKPFEDQNFVKKDFVEAVLEREKNFPTGLPTSIGVALPHTDANYVEKEGISIITLKEPVVFAGMGNPSEKVWVEIIFLLAISNPEKQLGVLQTIITIIQNEKVLQKIKSAKEPKNIYNLINQFI
ncbi:MAG: PTS sugar transporter subunit IIA [Eubacteriaceae bacterium]